jgi:hypothetical protein
VLISIQVLGYLLYLPLIWYGGNQFCRLIFYAASVETGGRNREQEAATLKAGRYIGLFERLLVSLGVLLQQWEILIAVVALKAVARYQEIDKQIKAEYFLVGSLASILWATAATAALLVYDRAFGFSLL